MVFFNYATMQMAAKIVYYGPGLCGKTTNLHHIYTKTSPGSRGEMVSLETETDRTLFFDLLPIDVGVIGGFKTRLQLYTVPGQVFYNTTRKLVLKGVDGIVFVADSQKAVLDASVDSFRNLRENLAEIGLNLDEIPVVLQLNKRDLPNIADVDVMLDALDPERRCDYVEAVAASGVGVFETLKVISKSTLRTLRRRMTGEDPVRSAASPRSNAQFRVQDNSRTVAGATPVPPPAIGHTTPYSTPSFVAPSPAASAAAESDRVRSAVATEIQEQEAPAVAPAPDFGDETIAVTPGAPTLDQLLGEVTEPEPAAELQEEAAPELLAEPAPAPEPEPEPEFQPEAIALVDPFASEPAITEPDVDFPSGEPEKQEAPAALKTVKVRNSVDVMAELEALRKRATQTTTPKASKRDPMADLAALRPKRDLTRTIHLQVPADVVPRAHAVRVTLSFEDGEAGVIETREQQLDLSDVADAQSLSVNLKIDLA
ncbi:MAG: mutual gliding-motility protein MglA [Acidobacteriota bacterium]|nr:mutual gliding-motility protein MglA [Acidobacteriota bacterium]